LPSITATQLLVVPRSMPMTSLPFALRAWRTPPARVARQRAASSSRKPLDVDFSTRNEWTRPAAEQESDTVLQQQRRSGRGRVGLRKGAEASAAAIVQGREYRDPRDARKLQCSKSRG
jgi:hypothetical protein